MITRNARTIARIVLMAAPAYAVCEILVRFA